MPLPDRRRTRLVLFPGLGADARLFEPQRKVLPFVEVPDWLAPDPGESLEAYGGRMAARVERRDGEALYVGGASFGGAIALEVARHLRPRAVLLIGSLRAPRALPRLYTWLGRGVAHCPPAVLDCLRWMAPSGAGFFGPATKEQRLAFLEQLRGTPTGFLHWGMRALLEWQPQENVAAPVFQIHGERDRVLPCRLAAADVVVPRAGHLINVTHADAVNAFLLASIAKCEERADAVVNSAIPPTR